VNTDDGRHIQLQPLQVLVKGAVAGVRRGRMRIVKVRLYPDAAIRGVPRLVALLDSAFAISWIL